MAGASGHAALVELWKGQDGLKEKKTSTFGQADLCVMLCKIQREHKSRRLRMLGTEGKIATVPQEAAVRPDTRHEETGEAEMNQGSDSFDVISM